MTANETDIRFQGDYITLTSSPHGVPTVSARSQSEDWYQSLGRCLNWNVRARQKALKFENFVDCPKSPLKLNKALPPIEMERGTGTEMGGGSTSGSGSGGESRLARDRSESILGMWKRVMDRKDDDERLVSPVDEK